jgi:hypothetical protein
VHPTKPDVLFAATTLSLAATTLGLIAMAVLSTSSTAYVGLGVFGVVYALNWLRSAVDAIAGWMWLEGVEGNDKIFYTTGRLTSEMVIKAAQMGIPFLVSRSGLTQMGYEIAQKVGITMIGRATNKHFLLFTGGERFRADA